jgi:parvulin-like peptidyl-prolyl isomerase
MTFRAKPVVKRAPRSPWESKDRRNFLLNLGFGLVVLAAVLILVVTVAATWYDDHLAPVAAVNGENITKDQFRERYLIEEFRLEYARRRVATEFAAGRLTDTQRQTQEQIIDQRRQVLPQVTLDRLVDARVQASLATTEGIGVADAAIDERLVDEATTPELRRIWVIEVRPARDEGATDPSAAQKAEAKAKAEAARREIDGGKAWEEVAKAVSTATSAPVGGDLGWLVEDTTILETDFATALFALESGAMTDVVEGDDGTFRFGRVTEIAPSTVDSTFEAQVTTAGIALPAYREAVRVDLVRKALEDKVVADISKPGLQRRVAEIWISEPSPNPPAEGAVKTRHILYAPNDDPAGAGELDEDDAAWAKAEEEARATYDTLRADITQFDRIARAESDEGGAATSGGKLPYFDPASSIDPSFAAAIFKDGLEAGDLLEPVKSGFGWHVIQVTYYPPNLDRAKALKAAYEAGEEFAQLARDNSESDTAADGGVVGWIAKGQLDLAREAAVFLPRIGDVSDPIEVDGDGIYLYRILDEETRTPEGEQLETLKATAFSNWYTDKKATFDIDYFGGAATTAAR